MNSGTCDFIITRENEFVKSEMKLVVLFTIVFKLEQVIKNSAPHKKCGEMSFVEIRRCYDFLSKVSISSATSVHLEMSSLNSCPKASEKTS